MRYRIIYLLWLVCNLILVIFTKVGGTLLLASIVFPVSSIVMNLIQKNNLYVKACDETFDINETVSIPLSLFGKGNFVCGTIYCENVLSHKVAETPFIGYAGKTGLKLRIKLQSENCGHIKMEVKSLKRYDLCRLSYKNMKLDISNLLLCLPTITCFDADKSSVNNEFAPNANSTQNKGLSDHSDINEIRNYKQGDSYKDIHWKLSFRLHELYIREYSTEISAKKMFCFSAETIRDFKTVCKDAENILSASWTMLGGRKGHYISSINQKTGEFNFDFVNNEQTYLVAQAHILSSYSAKVSEFSNEFSKIAIENNISTICIFRNNDVEYIDI